MNKTKKQYIFWDRVSGWSKAESAVNSTLVKCINTNFGVHIMPEDVVLDFGCGTGRITLQIAQSAGKVYGVDVSEGMLKHAQQNLRNLNVSNATFSKISALDEMFAEYSFDVITTFNVFQYIENREELFRQFHNLLKPQCKLIIAVPCFGDTNSFSASLVRFLRFVGVMPKTYFFSVEEIESQISGVGFTIAASINLSNLPEKFIVARKI